MIKVDHWLFILHEYVLRQLFFKYHATILFALNILVMIGRNLQLSLICTKML